MPLSISTPGSDEIGHHNLLLFHLLRIIYHGFITTSGKCWSYSPVNFFYLVSGGRVQSVSTPASSFPQPLLKLVEHPTEKPGALLTWVWVPSATWVFLPESTSSADSLTVSIQTLCAVPMPLSGHTKILQTPIGMSSAALAAAVPYPGKATRISSKGQWSTKINSF